MNAKKPAPRSGLLKKSGPMRLVLDLAVQGMATKKLVILLLLHAFGLFALVTGGHVAGNRFALSAGFGAFDDNVFSGHNAGLV